MKPDQESIDKLYEIKEQFPYIHQIRISYYGKEDLFGAFSWLSLIDHEGRTVDHMEVYEEFKSLVEDVVYDILCEEAHDNLIEGHFEGELIVNFNTRVIAITNSHWSKEQTLKF